MSSATFLCSNSKGKKDHPIVVLKGIIFFLPWCWTRYWAVIGFYTSIAVASLKSWYKKRSLAQSEEWGWKEGCRGTTRTPHIVALCHGHFPKMDIAITIIIIIYSSFIKFLIYGCLKTINHFHLDLFYVFNMKLWDVQLQESQSVKRHTTAPSAG